MNLYESISLITTYFERRCHGDQSFDGNRDNHPSGHQLGTVAQPVACLAEHVRCVHQVELQIISVFSLGVRPAYHVADQEEGVGARQRGQIMSSGGPPEGGRQRKYDDAEYVAAQSARNDAPHDEEINITHPVLVDLRRVFPWRHVPFDMSGDIAYSSSQPQLRHIAVDADR